MKTPIYMILNLMVMLYLFITETDIQVSLHFFLATFIISVLYLKSVISNGSLFYMLSPCSLAYFYSIFNYIFGALSFCYGWYNSKNPIVEASLISHNNLAFYLCYINICNMILCVILKKYSNCSRETIVEKNTFTKGLLFPYKSSTRYILLLIILFIALQYIEIDLSFLGAKALGKQEGGTGLTYPFVFGIIVAIAYQININKTSKIVKGCVYAFIIVVMAIISVESKRETFFVIISILMIETAFNDRKIALNLKTITFSSIFVLLSFVSIVASSIQRGYGSYNVQNFGEAVVTIPEYLQSDVFAEYGSNNFEVTYHYGTLLIALDYVIKGDIEVLYGETYFKALFVPIPRSVLGWKPRSMNDVYTSKKDPEFRRNRGSYPVPMYGEFFVNFHIFAIVIMFFFFLLLQKMYLKIKKAIKRHETKSLYIIIVSSYVLMFVRGNGLDALFLYSIISCFIIYILRRFEQSFGIGISANTIR